MRTTTPTLTDGRGGEAADAEVGGPEAGAEAGVALLHVARADHGHAIRGLRRGERLAPRILSSGAAGVEACVLPTQAGPLSGDEDRVRIVVGERATLVMRPVAATLALPGAARTLLALDIEVGEGARLVLDDPPLIVAAGADVGRSVTLTMREGAIVALRDTVVLGRAGEACGGRLRSVLRVADERGVVLHDELRLDPATSRCDVHVALGQGVRAVGTLCLLGAPVPADEAAFALARGGLLLRGAARGMADLEAELAEPWALWCLRLQQH